MKIDKLIPQSSPLISNDSLDKLRRSVPIRIDTFGQWWHEEERFKHPRLIQAFNRGLGWTLNLPPFDPQKKTSTSSLLNWLTQWNKGEGTVTIQDRWCYLDCDRTPFIGLSWKETDHLQVLSNHSSHRDQIWDVVGFFEHQDVYFHRDLPGKKIR